MGGFFSTKASLVQLRLLLPSVHRQFFDLEVAPSKQRWRNPFLVVMCGDACFGRSVVEFRGCCLSMNMYMNICILYERM